MKAANSAPLSQPTAAAPQSSAAAGGGGGVSLTPAVGRQDKGFAAAARPDQQVAGAANRRAGGNDDMAATAAAKLCLENHLNMLKMKEIEMMKTVPVNRYVFSAFLVAFTVFFCPFACYDN